jgi:hypothetical protein
LTDSSDFLQPISAGLIDWARGSAKAARKARRPERLAKNRALGIVDADYEVTHVKMAKIPLLTKYMPLSSCHVVENSKT